MKKLENKYWNKDSLVQQEIERLVIELDYVDDSDDEDGDSYNVR